MKPAPLNAAIAAKAKVMAMLEDRAEVCAIGIAVLDGGFGVKVNLLRHGGPAIPTEVDGVPVIAEVTGEIAAG